MKKFGRTWWGELWLDAFNGIDYSNRLPRGRSYATPARVLSMDVNDKKVTAKVQGRRRTPYKVSLSLKALKSTEKKRFINAIAGDPHAIGKLINGELPPSIYELAQAHGIELLPTSWDSVKGSCSCPDWAVPCKHMAAVVYLLSNEIDKDPFLIFGLHGMDLLGEVHARMGLTIQADSFAPNPFVESTDLDSHAKRGQSSLQLLDLDLSVIPDLGERILGLLNQNPLFSTKDFHAELAKHYKRTARSASRISLELEQDESTQIRDFRGKTLVLDEVGDFQCVLDDYGNKSHHTIDVWIEDLGSTRSLGVQAVNDGDVHAVFWYVLFQLVLVLLDRSAYVPQVLVFAPNTATIGWRAAAIDPTVTETLEKLYECCPTGLVIVTHETGNSLKKRTPDHKSQVDIALNALLTYFVRQAFDGQAASKSADLISNWFFTGSLSHFDWFGVANTPMIVQRWLNCLSLRDRSHRILIVVEELEDESLGGDESDDEWQISDVGKSDIQISLELKVQVNETVYSVSQILSDEEIVANTANILSDLTFLASYFPDLEQFLRASSKDEDVSIEYDLVEFAPILLESLPVLELLGVQLVLPKSLNKILRPQLNVKLRDTSNGSTQSFLELEDVISFDWQIALGDTRLSVDEFRQLVANTAGLVRIRDQYVLLDHDEVESIAKRIEKLPNSLSSLDLLKAHLTDDLEGSSIDIDRSIRSLIEEATSSRQLHTPKQLNAELRAYQHSGFEWLAHNARMGFGSILADDMGLGKTLQAITLLLHQKEQGELDKAGALVIVPTSLITNWRKELERFASSLSVHVYYGPQREMPKRTHDVVLASYGVIRSDVEKLSKKKFRTLIVDEAQVIKNPSAQQTRAVKRIRADVRIALSGTPVENRLLDYWSIFDFTMRGYLGTKTAFQRNLAKPIEFQRDQACLDRFRKLTRPFILRRLKTDKTIIKDLPEKLETDRYCTLTPAQASLYQNSVDALDASLNASETQFERQGVLLKLITALKQICNAPSHFLHRAYCGPEESGKLALFVNILSEALDADEKVLVFTQFKQMGDILVDCLKTEFGMDAPFLHGGLSRKKRDEQVDAFQNDSRVRAMILSLKAGGTGLNLTAASQIIHYDLWWNPAVETQATDRAYRIGQTKDVLVHRLLTENTFEERVNEMLLSKRDLADLTVADGEVSISDLSNEEIHELVALNE